jgi:CO/xanthine dehydrogenase FAD-binding subunit
MRLRHGTEPGWRVVDLNAVREICAAPDGGGWRQGDAWLAGGTALFSQPRPDITRLLDLAAFGWEPLRASPRGLEIAATCTVAELARFRAPPDWIACHPLFEQCRRAFAASFKVCDVATVGGNLCGALPVGPMISLAEALDGRCLIWGPGGRRRRLSVRGLVVGFGQNALGPGELLRSVFLPAGALRCRVAFRRTSLFPGGGSAVLLIGRTGPRHLTLTVTAATVRPVRLSFGAFPDAATLRLAVEQAIPARAYLDDVRGLAAWRRHLTLGFAEEIRVQLARRGTNGEHADQR